MSVADKLYVIGFSGFALVTIVPLFVVIWKYGPEISREARTAAQDLRPTDTRSSE